MPVLVFSHRRDRRFSVNAARFFTIDRTAMYRMMWVFLLFFFLCFIRYGAVAVAIDDDLLDYCIDGKFHKSKPGPEDDLHKQCTPWKERSCCTSGTTVEAHGGALHGFNFNHCPEKLMSEKCKQHFIQDLCFYECSPNVGPWGQKVDQLSRKERFYQVPLCNSDCESWFEACSSDLTCTDNWSRNFNWKNKTNQCPEGSQCQTFLNMFGNSSNFCQQVWDDSWKVTPDSQHCMRMWFDGSRGNPNDAVAAWKIRQSSGNTSPRTNPAGELIIATAVLTILSVAELPFHHLKR